MRWRYLILGVLLAGPTAAVVHVWPQGPEYVILCGEIRSYLGEDRQRGHLLFERTESSETGFQIERFSTWSGQLDRVVILADVPIEFGTHSLSADGSALLLRRRANDGDRHQLFPTRYAIFDSFTGARRGPTKSVYNPNDNARLSDDGHWLIAEQRSPNRLIFYDGMTSERLWFIEWPSSEYQTIYWCISPANDKLIYQRIVQTNAIEDRTLHLVSIHTGQELGSFLVPHGHRLHAWRESIIETWPPWTKNKHGEFGLERVGYELDGNIVKRTVNYSKLESTRIDEVHFEHLNNDEHTIRIEKPARSDQFIRTNMEKIIGALGVDVSLPAHSPVDSQVQIVNRRFGWIRFHMDVAQGYYKLVAKGSRLLIVRYDYPHSLNQQATQIEVYRTDPWPRWIFTTLTGGGVLAVLALFGRWRHKAIRRRKGN